MCAPWRRRSSARTRCVVRDRVKFRVGQIVYLAFSRDETLMGFAFPKEERDGLVAAEPHKFMLPKQGDMRYNWVVVRLAEIDLEEMTELVVDAWRMVVPKKVFAAYETEGRASEVRAHHRDRCVARQSCGRRWPMCPLGRRGLHR